MNLLLDTHILLWSLSASPRLKPAVREEIEDHANRVWVSAASGWEIAIKSALGKLRIPDDLLLQMKNAGFSELAIRSEHTTHLRNLPAAHRDPFDRILVAQAVCEGLTIVTVDPVFSSYPVRVIQGG